MSDVLSPPSIPNWNALVSFVYQTSCCLLVLSNGAAFSERVHKELLALSHIYLLFSKVFLTQYPHNQNARQIKSIARVKT